MKQSTISPNKKLKVFDFGEEDDRIEMDSDQILSRFTSPKKSKSKSKSKTKFPNVKKSLLDKYKFLQFFTKRTDKTMPKKVCDDPIDVDSSSAVHKCVGSLSFVPGAQVSNEPIDVDTSNPDLRSVESLSFVPGTSDEHGACRNDESGDHSSEGFTSSAKCLNFGCEPIGVISDDENTTSSFLSQRSENEARERRFGENIIYPKDEPDAVSISKRDVELLQPEIFINDTIIDFYMKYMKNKLTPEEKQRFHFFNCFFFRKLAASDNNPLGVSQGKAAFQRVRKWTQNVNLFEKDYIIIPVNSNLHWSLIIICHLGEIAYFTDEEVDSYPRLPCILHMDSKRGSHTGLKDLIQGYIYEEWTERQSERLESIPVNKFNLRFFSLKVPQQDNLYDCGLFLLHYVECFLKEAPVSVNFKTFQSTKSSSFLSKDWFPPAEASRKRADIRKLLLKMFDDDDNHNATSQSADTNEISGSVIERFEDMCSSSRIQDDIPLYEYNDNKIPAIVTSPAVKCSRRPRLFSGGVVQQGVKAESFPLYSCRKNVRSSPIMEGEEIEEQVSKTQSNNTDFYEVHVVDEQPINPKVYVHIEEQDDDNSSSIKETVSRSHEETVVESSTNSCEDFEGFVVEDSQEPDEMHDGISTIDFRRTRYR